MPAIDSTKPDLFTPLQLGELELPNRIVLAPLTRNRAGPGNVPQAMNTTYCWTSSCATAPITARMPMAAMFRTACDCSMWSFPPSAPSGITPGWECACHRKTVSTITFYGGDERGYTDYPTL